MSKKAGFIKERNSLLHMAKSFFVVAKADEPTGEPVQEPVQEPKVQTINYEDLIANARKQEKEKLYPQIKKLEDEKNSLISKNNEALLTLGEKENEIQSLKAQIKDIQNNSTKGESETITTLRAEVENLKAENKKLNDNLVSRDDLEKEIRSEYEVKLYREQKLREVGDNVIPELVHGTTKEEIDNSIKVAQDRYNEITSKVLGNIQAPINNGGVSSTFKASDLKVEDLVNLDARSPEYAQLRAKLGLK